MKCRETQFQSDLEAQTARSKQEKKALIEKFKTEQCDLRKVLL